MGKYKALGTNIFLFALNTFATKLISFVLIPIYTSYLTQSEYGIADLLAAVIWMLFPLATLSLSDAAMRFIIDDEKNSKQYATLGLLSILFSCVLVFCLLPFLDFSFFGGLGDYKLEFFGAYVFCALASYFSYVARGLNQVKLISICSVLQSLVIGFCSVWTIAYLEIGIIGYFYAYILGGIVGSLVYVIGGKQYKYISFNKESLTYLRPMLLYSIPLVPNAFFWWMDTNINRLFITGLLGISAAGMYAAATKIPTLLNLVYGIFQQAWQLSAFQEFKKQGIEHFFNTVFLLVNVLLLIGSSVLIICSPMFASILLKKDFFNAWTLMPLLVLASYFNIITTFLGTAFTTSMKTHKLFYSMVIGAISCVILSYLLIRAGSLVGAAAAMVISNMIVVMLRLRDVKEILSLNIPYGSWIFSIIIITIQVILITLGQYNIGVQLGLLIGIIAVQAVSQQSLIRSIARRFVHR